MCCQKWRMSSCCCYWIIFITYGQFTEKTPHHNLFCKNHVENSKAKLWVWKWRWKCIHHSFRMSCVIQFVCFFFFYSSDIKNVGFVNRVARVKHHNSFKCLWSLVYHFGWWNGSKNQTTAKFVTHYNVQINVYVFKPIYTFDKLT